MEETAEGLGETAESLEETTEGLEETAKQIMLEAQLHATTVFLLQPHKT